MKKKLFLACFLFAILAYVPFCVRHYVRSQHALRPGRGRDLRAAAALDCRV